jgi:hypothetical protein
MNGAGKSELAINGRHRMHRGAASEEEMREVGSKSTVPTGHGPAVDATDPHQTIAESILPRVDACIRRSYP